MRVGMSLPYELQKAHAGRVWSLASKNSEDLRLCEVSRELLATIGQHVENYPANALQALDTILADEEKLQESVRPRALNLRGSAQRLLYGADFLKPVLVFS